MLADRTIRVFISSTFRDLHEEREELVKRVFPLLREMCAARRVSFTDIDLRWGISDQQRADGHVLPICLAEIDRCRPFFVGLLAERYGWVPENIDPSVIEAHPWLAGHRGKSVTELEILYGVLNDPRTADRAFFYFRDPAYLLSLPPATRREHVEDVAENREKLNALKDRIRGSGLAVRERYPDPRALGELVLRDLQNAINRAFPPEAGEPDPLARDAAEHEAYARSRAVVQVGAGVNTGSYVRQPQLARALDDHAAGSGPPLVVLGKSGSGKSALLANWGLERARSA